MKSRLLILFLAIYPSYSSVWAANLPRPQALPTPEQSKAEISRCGVPEGHITLRFDEDPEDGIFWIENGDNSATDQVLTCIARVSAKDALNISFRGLEEERRYHRIYSHVIESVELKEARNWLNHRGLLSTLPAPTTGMPLASYAASVEALCGLPQNSMLLVVNEHTLTYNLKAIVNHTASSEQFGCVTNAVTAADIQSHGIFLAVIGSEQAQ